MAKSESAPPHSPLTAPSALPGTTHSAWSRNTPLERRHIEDARLLEYRHPAEWPALVIALAVLVLGFAIAIRYDYEELASGIALLWIGVAVGTWLQLSETIGSGVEVTPTQFAHLHPAVEELRRRFRMPRTRVFIQHRPGLNAYAFGFSEPYVVVFHAPLVEALDLDEFKYVLGHEMAHIKFGHTRLGVFLGSPDMPVPGVLAWFAYLRALIFNWWYRAQEMSCDRAGVVATRRVSTGISTMVKLAVGPRLYEHVHVDEFGKQAAELSKGWGRVGGFLSELSADHPFVVNRIKALVEWAGPPEAGHTLRLRDPQAFHRTAPREPTAGTGE
ncbi:MAG TPA: M48 family metallopeptidase [Chloroflexota bacterium]|nr:M48 family metallopeptidase [Chloroflexota bacterium]